VGLREPAAPQGAAAAGEAEVWVDRLLFDARTGPDRVDEVVHRVNLLKQG
jgi:hypothetical protein